MAKRPIDYYIEDNEAILNKRLAKAGLAGDIVWTSSFGFVWRKSPIDAEMLGPTFMKAKEKLELITREKDADKTDSNAVVQ